MGEGQPLFHPCTTHEYLTGLMKSVPISVKIIWELVSNYKTEVDKVNVNSHIEALGEEICFSNVQV